MSDIKSKLYGLLGKKKLGLPVYNVASEQHGIQQRFVCELRVPGIDYVGQGFAQSKKDAQSNAARDFGSYLVQKGLITAAELPALSGVAVVGGGQLGYQMKPDLQAQAVGGGGIMDIHQGHAVHELPLEPTVQQTPSTSYTNSSPLSTIQNDPCAEQKPSAALLQRTGRSIWEMEDDTMFISNKPSWINDSMLDAASHGGYTANNCRQFLNEWCQRNNLTLPNIEVAWEGGDQHSGSFVATTEFFVPHLQRNIQGRGEGSSKRMARFTCSLTLVRQLFHMGVLPEANKVAAEANRQGSAACELPPIKVRVDESLRHRIRAYLKQAGLTPANSKSLKDATPDAPFSLLSDMKPEHPITDSHAPSTTGSIPWAPGGQPNWDAWRSVDIDEGPLSQLSIDKISGELLGRERAKAPTPSQINSVRESLPVHTRRHEILDAINESQVVLIKGTTGCGKSTQVCQYLLEDHLETSRGALFNCYVTQPRRISAITLAERVAYERSEQVGDSVGHSVRFETLTPRPYGAIMFVTVGVLLRRMESGLRGISHLIVDEVHDINTDLLLIIVREMVRANPQLKVVLMSATADTQIFSDYFGQGCRVLEIEQRLHHVSSYFLEDIIQMLDYTPPPLKIKRSSKKKKLAVPETYGPTAFTTHNNQCKDEEEDEVEGMDTCGEESDKPITAAYKDAFDSYLPAVQEALSRMNERQIPLDLIELLLSDIDKNGREGAVLIFLPGWNIISTLLSRLQQHQTFGDTTRFVLLPLHSQLSSRDQRRVFEPIRPGQRKIVLSTNLAETSVTIDDVVYVIDGCRAREKVHSTLNNTANLTMVWASRTSLMQRRGRAGRVQEGYCFHLCTRVRFDMMDEHPTPEILRTPLTELILFTKLLCLGPASQLLEKAVQPPPPDAVAQAESLLQRIGALNRKLDLTPLGRILARLPVDPMMGKALVLAAALGVGDLMCTLAAASSFNSPFVPMNGVCSRLAPQHRSFSGRYRSDQVGLLVVNQQYTEQVCYGQSETEYFCQRNSLSSTVLAMSQKAKEQLRGVLMASAQFPPECFRQHILDPWGTGEADPELDLFLSILVYSYYPNICRQIKWGKRQVYTLDQRKALMSKHSVCMSTDPSPLPSPLFVYAEKLRTGGAFSCRQLTQIIPLQLLLFGSGKVEAVGPGLVCLDGMIGLEMDAGAAAEVVALRAALEELVIRVCVDSRRLTQPTEGDKKLCALVRAISSQSEWFPTGDEAWDREGLAPTSQHSRLKGPNNKSTGQANRRGIVLRPFIVPVQPVFNPVRGDVHGRKRSLNCAERLPPRMSARFSLPSHPIQQPTLPAPFPTIDYSSAAGFGSAPTQHNQRARQNEIKLEMDFADDESILDGFEQWSPPSDKRRCLVELSSNEEKGNQSQSHMTTESVGLDKEIKGEEMA